MTSVKFAGTDGLAERSPVSWQDEEQLQCGGAELFGLVDDDPFQMVPGAASFRGFACYLTVRCEVLFDADGGAGVRTSWSASPQLP